jgi:hypothetical protein
MLERVKEYLESLRRHRAPPAPEPEAPDAEKVEGETVAWFFEYAQSILDAQRDRFSALEQKATHLAGFAGVVLAILAAVASDGVGDQLSGVAEAIVTCSLIVASSAMVLTLVVVVLGVLLTSPYRSVGAEEIALHLGYEDGPLLEVPAWAPQVRASRAILEAVADLQLGASAKAARVNLAAASFVLGTVAAAVGVLTLVICGA